MDKDGNKVSRGAEGELWIAGAGVSAGYLHAPGLTAKRFIEFNADGQRTHCYRSGDLVREHPEGEFAYIGRIDGQIKLRGIRIELAEIERALTEHPHVEHAALAKVDGPAGPMLIAMVVCQGAADVSSSDAREFLGTRLPAHMLPNRVIDINALPLTPSGKLDRNAVAVIARSCLPQELTREPSPEADIAGARGAS